MPGQATEQCVAFVARGADGVEDLVFKPFDARHQIKLTRDHLTVEQLQQIGIGNLVTAFGGFAPGCQIVEIAQEIAIDHFGAVDLPGGGS